MIKIHKGVVKGVKYWWYTVEGTNGKVLVTSETFTRKGSCIKSIDALKLVMDNGAEVVDETK